MENCDITYIISTFLDTSSLLNARLINKQFRSSADIVLYKRRDFYNFKLTLPQYVISQKFISGKNIRLNLRIDKGFGSSVFLIACCVGPCIIYCGKELHKKYKRLITKTLAYTELNVGGLSSYVKLGDENTKLFLAKNNRSLARIKNLSYFDEFMLPSLIIDARSDEYPKEINTALYYRIISIHDRTPKNIENKFRYMRVSPRHSFLLCPKINWIIKQFSNMKENYINVIYDCVKKYKRIILTFNSDYITEDLVLKLRKEKLLTNKFKLNNTKSKILIEYSSEVSGPECIITMITKKYCLTDIMNLGRRKDSSVSSCDLILICDEMYELCVYAKIHSFRPWISEIRGEAFKKNPNEEDLKLGVAVDLKYEDPADKCVMCCYRDYFSLTSSKKEFITNWWERNKSDNSLLNREIIDNYF
jgi:hypothetical protein